MGFTEKYRPDNIEDFIGNKKGILDMSENISKKPLLIHGPIGVGKTLSCYLLAKK